MKIEGGCHCGQFAYEAEIESAKVSLCHCTDCQTLSGTAFRTNVPTVPGGFRVTRGAVKIYIKTVESGRQREQAFCPECGTPIYAASPGAPEPRVLGIRVGSIRQRRELMPQAQVWHRSALPWTEHAFDDIPSFEVAQTTFRAEPGKA